jgi:hypothetical protein
VKAKGCAVLGCFGVVVLAAAVAALLGLGALARRVDVASTAPEGATPSPLPPDETPTPTSLEPVQPFKVRTAAPPPSPTDGATPAPEPGLVPMQPFRVRTAAPPPTASAPPVVPLPVTLPPPMPPRDGPPDPFMDDPGEWRLFSRQEEGARYRLQFGFVDYSGRRHKVSCSIVREAVERASRAFGFDRAEMAAEISATLQQAVDREIERRGLSRQVQITVLEYGGWRFEAPKGTPDAAEVQGLETWLRTDYARLFAHLQTAAFERRGLVLRGQLIRIDHNALARAATRDLDECYDALAASGGAISERQFMGLLVAFFQELKYELPPDKIGNRDTLGLWVPARVIADGKGDCDSKAVAFAAFWRRRSSRVIVVEVPEHALVGVEARPGPGERIVRVGNRYYVLCEVAGPRKRPPGSSDASGSFEFVSIDP